MNVKKKILSGVLAAAMAASLLSGSALAVTNPTTTMNVDPKVPTTLSQRAASEIPQVFGLGVKAGTVFNGYLNLAGTTATATPDGYAWNYNAGSTDHSIAYYTLSDKLTNANGLYSSGGGNQVYAGSVDEDGNVTLGKAVGLKTDIIVGFSSITLAELDEVHDNPSDYDGYENYHPAIIDVQTGSVSSRLYSWAEMGAAISDYVKANNPAEEAEATMVTRYGDAYVNGLNVEQFSAGIPYYIASLIADGEFAKKKAAYVNAYSDAGATESSFVCVNPATLGNVSADVFAEVNNFNFITGTYTLQGLLQQGVDVIILSATGYSYTEPGTGTTVGGGSSTTNEQDKANILNYANTLISNNASANYKMPLVMSSANYSITIGNNGYNYSPITCMFMPYIQAYAYMDELAEENSAINPMAMFRFMMEECFHVSSSMSEAVAQEYIGSSWTAVNTYDQVPSTTNYVYNKTAIINAIVDGMEYALDKGDNGANANGNKLLAAYRVNDNAYIMLNEYLTDEEPDEDTRYITIEIDEEDYYLDLDAEIELGEDDDSGQFTSVAMEFSAIVSYYYERNYGDYGWNLQETLQYYANHMVDHVWEPVIGVPGTYGSGITPLPAPPANPDV